MTQTTAGRKLGRKGGARVSLLRSLATHVLLNEQIKTTYSKAKECSRFTERLISLAKKGDLNARRAVRRDVHDQGVREKLFDVLAKRYETRTGGYTQVFRINKRQGDNTEMALLRLVS